MGFFVVVAKKIGSFKRLYIGWVSQFSPKCNPEWNPRRRVNCAGHLFIFSYTGLFLSGLITPFPAGEATNPWTSVWSRVGYADGMVGSSHSTHTTWHDAVKVSGRPWYFTPSSDHCWTAWTPRLFLGIIGKSRTITTRMPITVFELLSFHLYMKEKAD